MAKNTKKDVAKYGEKEFVTGERQKILKEQKSLESE